MAGRLYSPFTYLAAAAASLASLALVKTAFRGSHSADYPAATPSPLIKHRQTAAEKLAYPPDSIIAGARDVPTPYGTIRIYEFGPETAQRKVLFIHGISTPSISLVGIAENLAFKKGCRVMLMDLFGRGWSDGVPDLPYDGRLYASQVFMALASSPLPWTGAESGGFGIVGYSLGGCIAADFTSWFPELVRDLVLIAPAGLQRHSNIDWKTRLIYSGLMPESWAEAAVRRRLRVSPNVTGKQKARVGGDERGEGEAAPSAELPKDAVITTSRGEIDMVAAVNWQMDYHEGFMPSFMSSIRHAPIRGQQQRWRLIGARLRIRREMLGRLGKDEATEEEDKAVLKQGLESGRVLIIFGGEDRIVRASEVGPDAKDALGSANVLEKIYEDAGHDVAVSHGDDIAEEMWEMWLTT